MTAVNELNDLKRSSIRGLGVQQMYQGGKSMCLAPKNGSIGSKGARCALGRGHWPVSVKLSRYPGRSETLVPAAGCLAL
jgi:hypothetical protein